jgi:hypothetical protein
MAFSLFVGLFVQLVLASIGFFVHISLNLFYPIIGLITIFGTLAYLDKKSSRIFWKDALSIVIIIISSYILASYIPDFSYDGHTYHSPSTYLFMNGLNPVYESASELLRRLHPIIADKLLQMPGINYYPKSSELSSAIINLPFWSMEAGKSINMLLGVVVFLYSCSIFVRMKIKKSLAMVFSLLLFWTPITIVQMFTYYVDANAYYLCIITLLAILDVEISERKKLAITMAIMSTTFIAGVKVIGFIDSAIFLGCYFAYVCWKRRSIDVKRLALAGLIIGSFISITCWNPYIKNILAGHHILYMFAGKNAMIANDMGNQGDFRFDSEATRIEKLLVSTFTPPSNHVANVSIDPLPRKIPFTYYNQKLNISDMRYGGFGFWWSGILLICLFLWRGLNTDNEGKKMVSRIILFPLLVSVLLNPFSWWARYVPQFWAFPIFILVFSVAFGNRYFKKKLVLPAVLLLFFGNNIVSIDWRVWAPNIYIVQQLEFLRNVSKKDGTVLLYFEQVNELFVNYLSGERIEYRIVNKDEFEKSRQDFDIVPNDTGTKIYANIKKSLGNI